MNRGDQYREMARKSAPNYRRSQTCYNCAYCSHEGFLGEDTRCTLHEVITAWDMSIAEMRMSQCCCDDWRKIE